MIAYVEGRIAEITDNACLVITAGGVGYEVYLTAHSLARLSGQGAGQGESVHFFAATVVREDALELYGFETWDERETFFVLTGINRVGSRTAMAILSVFRPDDLRRMVAEEDMLSLTRVPGIGKKTGQQIFLELKYKLKGQLPGPAPKGQARPSGLMADVVAGLLNLGYAEDEALDAVKGVLQAEGDLDVGGALRASLKVLARKRS